MMKRFSMIACLFTLALFSTSQAAAKEVTIRGHLEQTVEAGGWLIVVDTDERTDKYLLLNSKSFQNEPWFRAGATVEATGEVKSDVVTIYQQGIPFEARTMREVSSNGNAVSPKQPIKPSRKHRRARRRAKVHSE